MNRFVVDTMALILWLEKRKIPAIPELHDRLIAASGKELGISILTNDPDIQNSAFVNAIWE